MKKTTIQINLETLKRLKILRHFEKQTYDDILNNLIDNCDDEILSEKEISEIQQGLEDIKRGKVKPIGQVAEELGIILK